MQLDDLIVSGRRTLSLEFFPAKTAAAEAQLQDSIARLAGLGPDFMSVTYGAGGSTRERTRRTLAELVLPTGIMGVAHLTCVNATHEDLLLLLDEYHAAGLRNVLALRGDPPRGQDFFTPVPGGCDHAIDLIRLIRSDGRFGVACAAFPEGHPEAVDRAQDWRHLADKFRAGACMAMTQAFFDTADYLAMMEALTTDLGYRPHVVPGLMPISSWPWLVDFVARFCPNTRLPEDLRAELEPLAGDPAASAAAGLARSLRLAVSLLEAGAPGLHIYTMNRPEAAEHLVTTLRTANLLPLTGTG